VSVLEPLQASQLRSILEEGPPIQLAVLFGSRARGKARASSDVDIGIVPADPGLSLREELALASALSAALSVEVDLVRLDGDNPLLAREVARDGIALFEARPGAFAAYRATAVARWIEMEEMIAPHRERFLRRLAGAGV
jgi:predicted nucleotidyltransferase